VIVLDDTRAVEEGQLKWLEERLGEAKADQEPAIVVGNANLNAQINAHEAAAENVGRALIAGGASAYFFDAPEENVKEPLRMPGGSGVETFGSGTLGYVNFLNEVSPEFHGASGFLIAEVGPFEAKGPAKVNVRLIPNIEELALEAEEGTLLRRSEAALFTGLARRPRAGNRSERGQVSPITDPYIPIPENCFGTGCETRDIRPEYRFSSESEGEKGEFVEPNLASAERNGVLLGAGGKPIVDNDSGLFCALNPGRTTVTITAGGLSASLPVTIEAGSVRQPCGTAPVKNPPQRRQNVAPPAPAPPAPAPAVAPAATPPPIPLPPPPAAPAAPPVTPRVAALPPFVLPAVATTPVFAFVPPPLPTPARPTPPSGTSAVTSPVEVAEHEEEEEQAPESVSNQAVAYSAPEQEPAPAFVLGAVLLAALAGASIGRRIRGRREPRVAPATLTSMRAQRRMQTRDRHLP